MKAISTSVDAGRRLIRVALTSIFLTAVLSAQNAAVVAHDAWARVPNQKGETAIYMVVDNHSAQARAIISVSSAEAAKVEMHEMKMTQSKGGTTNMPGMSKQSMMVMTPVSQIAIPANGQATLEPNGYHMMVFGLKSKLAAGDKIPVTLKLDDGTTVEATATIRK